MRYPKTVHGAVRHLDRHDLDVTDLTRLARLERHALALRASTFPAADACARRRCRESASQIRSSVPSADRTSAAARRAAS